jgi:CubicO group peptidase (beta-lactamase class C family)
VREAFVVDNRRLASDPVAHPPPAQSDGVPFPTEEWPIDELPGDVHLLDLVATAFDPEGPLHHTYAVAIAAGWYSGGVAGCSPSGMVRGSRSSGRPRSRPGRWPSPCSTPWSEYWSTRAGWRWMIRRRCPGGTDPGEPCRAITLRHLLEMRDGLEFTGDILDAETPDVMKMLFGEGQTDVAAFAADRPPPANPVERFSYSSGTGNVISGIVAREVGPGQPYRRFLGQRPFSPLGMASATAASDDVGTWVAASYVYATAQDYARFGLLYLRDGMWNGRRLLPDGWADQGHPPRSVDPDDGMLDGVHWWIREDRLGTYFAAGHEGQFIDICPASDLVVVRLGKTLTEQSEDVERRRVEVAEAFA